MTHQIKHVQLFAETLPLTISDQGQGQPYLILHGGGGPMTVAGFAGALGQSARAIAPTHPGFAGQARPSWFDSIGDLSLAYLALLEKLDLRDVIVIGNSVGGWIAAEMALRKSPRVAGIMLLNACGIDAGPSNKGIADPTKLTPQERAKLAFHDPVRYGIAPATPEAAAAMAANQQTLRVYAGAQMVDTSLQARLADVPVPAMVVWGESDGIVDVEYGRLFADSMPGSQFEIVAEAGHFPHIEQLAKVVELTQRFTRTTLQKQRDQVAA